MSIPVIVLGAGGHAKVLIETLLRSSVEVLGVTDPNPDLHDSSLFGLPVLGGDEVLRRYLPGAVMLVNGLGSAGRPLARTQLYEKFSTQGYAFANVIHPSATLASDLVLGSGVQLMAGVVVQPGVRLGDNVVVNTRVAIDHDCVIGSHSHLAPGVTLSGQVTVGEMVHIGTAAAVINNVRIGKNCLIGAGSLVLGDIPDNVTAYGAPAKVVSK
jgi:UDP-perosamine 4-acetyltransferase